MKENFPDNILLKSLSFFLLFIFSSAICDAKIFYISPAGNDNNTGTIKSPFKTLNKAWQLVSAGDTVYMRGGTYLFTGQPYLTGKSGKPGKLIKVWAYPGEKPVITKHPSNYTSDEYSGMHFEGNYVHFKGLEITGFNQKDHFIASGLRVENSNHNIFELLNIHHNGHGLYMQGSSTGNLFLNSDFHHNYDVVSKGEHADGLGIAYITPGCSNTVRGCRAWWNSDDGFDVFENQGYVLFENCWAWYNGYLPDTFKPSGGDGEGWKLGSLFLANGKFHNTVLRTVRNCLSFKNYNSGFHQEEADCKMELYNNTAYANRIAGFQFDYRTNNAHVFKNNLSYANQARQAVVSSRSSSDRNAASGNGAKAGWSKAPVTNNDFLSLSELGIDKERKPDGSLPSISFLHLKAGSGLIDAGINVGLPFKGKAPDIGAVEYE